VSSNRLKLGVAGALLLGGVAAILFEHHVSARLLEENDRLMEEGREFASLRQENARLKKETASLTANLHAASAAALTAAHDRAAGRAGEGAHGGFPLAPGLVSIRLLGNAGRGSPRAAFQTQLWAARNGDDAAEAKTNRRTRIICGDFESI